MKSFSHQVEQAYFNKSTAQSVEKKDKICEKGDRQQKSQGWKAKEEMKR